MTGIRDLARHLDISIGTVSRALNGKPDVSPKTRQLVLDAAAELGYEPNFAGRSLRQGSSNVVGFMLATDSDAMMQGDLFFVRVFDGMQSVLCKHDLDLVALLVPSSEDAESYLRRTVARQSYDALVLSSTLRSDARIDFLAQKNIPFVTLGRSLTDGGQPWLDLDFEGMVQTSIARLVEKGHKDIAIALPEGEVNLGYLMLESYQRAIEHHGLTLRSELILTARPGDAGGHDLAATVCQMASPATAIICSDHILPFGIYRGLADLGLTPGKDLAVIGVGTRLSSLLTPKLTHYRFNLFELGQRLATALLETMPRFQGESLSAATRETVPFSLIEGESDGAAL